MIIDLYLLYTFLVSLMFFLPQLLLSVVVWFQCLLVMLLYDASMIKLVISLIYFCVHKVQQQRLHMLTILTYLLLGLASVE